MGVIDTYPTWADRARVVVIGGITLYLALLGAWVAVTAAKVRRAWIDTSTETETETNPTEETATT